MASIAKLAPIKSQARSRVANGSSLHSGDVDGRSLEARRFRDVFHEILSDLGGEGLSEGQRQLARVAALLSVRSEKIQALAVQTGELDVDEFCAIADRLGRTFHRLGLRRVARDVGPRNLHEYAAAKAKAKPA